ncbi:MAG: hypothetical protein GWM92_08975, partial [Gemmatimonadetes bacterium]|nr:hypothetical protein [Gemmatimonadota bacterium]NIR78776.1 hypothetical protein [Gemmatimonadota bacterium]NIT87413.1 hypothetical protein [Gemmatimonadota bacterium]NIU31265.1 hypothetical protein [Gemmatimonadota bacterium]NIU35975.1 hypothetical protein [Gemmatimonadota bacterium]
MNRLTRARAREIFDAARSVRVLVVGDVMLDRYVTGRVDRISPEAPVPVLHYEDESAAVGGAGNVAANVTALGARCRLVGIVGDDAQGAAVREALEEVGVEAEGVRTAPDRPTTVKTRILARRQQVVRVDREVEGDVSPNLARSLEEMVREGIPGCDAVVLEDYNKGVLVQPVIRAGLDGARAAGIPSVVDPKRIRFFEYGGCSLFKPNAKELEEAAGERLRPDDPEWMGRIRRRLGCENLLLTLGELGMALQVGDRELIRIAAAARSVYDVSGAGDTVTAVLATA